MKTFLLLITLSISANIFAQTITSENDSQDSFESVEVKNEKIRYNYMINKTVDELKSIFMIDDAALSSIFHEFKIVDLLNIMNETKINIVNEVLIDKDGSIRTCLNFPTTVEIKCSLSEMNKVYMNRDAVYILLLHEYLGLMGIEETSSKFNDYTMGYSISNRIAMYLTSTNSYDLVFDKSTLNGYEGSMQLLVINREVRSNFFIFSEKNTSSIKKDYIKQSLEYIKERCEKDSDQRIVFMDVHVYNLETRKVKCGKRSSCLNTSGTILARFICE